MVDKTGRLNLAYWTATNHILYRAYTYSGAADALSLVDGPTQLDASGSSNHSGLAVNGDVSVNGNVVDQGYMAAHDHVADRLCHLTMAFVRHDLQRRREPPLVDHLHFVIFPEDCAHLITH